jgi:hypothetical protein
MYQMTMFPDLAPEEELIIDPPPKNRRAAHNPASTNCQCFSCLKRAAT